jgi:hypothetical protein
MPRDGAIIFADLIGKLSSMLAFISANGSASHRILMIDALVRPKEKGQAMVTNPALTTSSIFYRFSTQTVLICF